MSTFIFNTSIDIPLYSDTNILVTCECVDPGEPASYNDPGYGPDIRIRSVIVDDLDDHPLNGAMLDVNEMTEANQEYLYWLSLENYDERFWARASADMRDAERGVAE